MQAIDLKADDVLNLDQIVDCLTDASETVTHCADNYMSIEFVMKIVEAALLCKAKQLCDVGKLECKPVPGMTVPPWALPATAPVSSAQPKRRAAAKRQG
ncbi:hypothetical protein [Caenibius sp. WL]|uniref:hypothetical protein n=1 Tax=Caenibius sp. WL TaxID=2872646 RepID=UPI001C990269|nr:hypothetical protein [Caenibius sp. WL]QZP07092.1 hypothetical protein K5X80_10260 [Caenibius sp. WL]